MIRLALGRTQYRVFVGSLWLLIVVGLSVPCAEADGDTAAGASAHALMWVTVGILSIGGLFRRAWRIRPGWAHLLLAGGILNAIIDVLAFRLITVCYFRVSIIQLQSPLVRWPLDVIAAVLLFSPILMAIALLSVLTGRTRDLTSFDG